MLRFNLTNLMQARGIRKPSQYLIKTLGIGSNSATDLKMGRTWSLNLRHVSTLCYALKCTPNDLLEWMPEKGQTTEGHPLNKLKRENTQELIDIITDLPYEKTLEMLKELKGKN